MLFPSTHVTTLSAAMVTKFVFLRPPSLPLLFLSSPHLISLKTKHLSLSLSTAALNQTLSYGPSLSKGIKPSQEKQNQQTEVDSQQNNDVIDTERFTRIFQIYALRVPSDLCFALESRLRGHLLNWPRVRNIARVPNDELEPQFQTLLSSHTNSDLVINRRIYGKAEGDGEELSPVLYRDLLARKFNSKGFVKFRNLAKMSRPRKRVRREKEKGKGVGKSEVVEVEVIEENVEYFSGLLGEGFRGGERWKGSTRLLLLDEGCAGKGVEELPEAIKVDIQNLFMLLSEEGKEEATSNFKLVRCKVTLFYNYWQMNEILEALLPSDVIVPSAFETVGHIAHLNLRDEHLPYKEVIAKVVLDKNKPKIQTVVNKIDAIHNDYRTMPLEVLAGNHSLVTIVVENGLRFHVDLETVYWNSRLATERQRLLNYFTRDDIVCDVFAGVGPIAVSAARKVKYVYANDLNPHAVDYLRSNCILNKLERKIEVFNMDGRRFIDSVFASRKGETITQVVMNLPNDAVEYLDIFKGIFRSKSQGDNFTLPKIHVYGFLKAQDPEFEFQERIRIALSEVAFEIETHRVRLVAPGKWMMCASFVLPESVTLAKPSQAYI